MNDEAARQGRPDTRSSLSCQSIGESSRDAVCVDAIPFELRERPQWVIWRAVERDDGKTTKVPYRADGTGRASSTDAFTWSTFEAALAGAETLSAEGLGFVFTESDPYFGLDLDDELSAADRAAIVLALDTYTELSPSGKGMHVVGRGSLYGAGRHPAGLGVFDRSRYFTFTGRHVVGTPATIEERQEQLDALLAEFLPIREPARSPLPPRPVDLDDQELLERMFASKSGDKIRRLWEGNWSAHSSQSEGDYALLTHLAFWTDRDAPRMESLFCTSALYRKEGPQKPKGIGYLARTIEAAIEATSEVYRPRPAPRPNLAPRSPRPSPLPPLEEREVETPPPTSPRRLHSWVPLDLVTRSARPPTPPEIIGLLYPGYNHLVSGESEALKTWLALVAAAVELAAGRGVLWVDGDDVGEGAVLERLRLLGVEDDAISRQFAYLLPDEKLDEGARGDVLEVVRSRNCRLAVLDGFNPLLVLHGLNPDSGTDVEKFYRLIDPIRKAPTAVFLSDNVVKASEARGAWAIGSERKKSKAEVHLGMKTLVPLVRGGTGRAQINVHKDRPGHLQRPSPGILVLTSGDTCSWHIEDDPSHGPEGEFRPTKLMERVSRYLELRTEPAPRGQIEEGVTGKRDYVRVAIDCLVSEGYATEFEGPRKARLVRLDRRFREDEDEA